MCCPEDLDSNMSLGDTSVFSSGLVRGRDRVSESRLQ